MLDSCSSPLESFFPLNCDDLYWASELCSNNLLCCQFYVIVLPLYTWLSRSTFLLLCSLWLYNSSGDFDDDPVAAQAIKATIGRNKGIKVELQLRRNDPALTELK